MKLIVGLGNPGEKYMHNRHNVGFMVVDELILKMQESQSLELEFKIAKKFEAEIVQAKDFILAKPQTFMNDSGQAVSAIARFYKIESSDIYIIHDDLDIPMGKYKIVKGHGPKVHNGLGSVREHLGEFDFWYVKVGVENREVRGNSGIPGVEYSLQNFRPEERVIIDNVIDKIVGELSALVAKVPNTF